HFYSTLATINLQPKRKACLMANIAMELAFEDQDIINKVKNYMEMYMKSFLYALSKAQQSKELPENLNIESVAKFLTTNLHGLGIMAKCGATEDDLNQIISVTLSVLEK
ncbi:MAG: TetR family transcriptional regulator C-terminal domain-containing protein, partial [Candidatus Kariarchaeaceae archaeon]